MIGLEHFHERPYNASRSIEFSGILSFRRCKHGQAVFIGSAEDILAIAMLLHVDVCKEVHDIAKALLIQFRTGKVLGEDSLQAVVLFFDKAHGFVNLDANLGSVCIGSDYFPAGLLRYPEDALAGVLILVLLHSVTFCHEFIVSLLEAVGNIFQEDKSQNNMLILRGIHAAPQFVRCAPDLFLKSYVSRIGFGHDMFVLCKFRLTHKFIKNPPYNLIKLTQSTHNQRLPLWWAACKICKNNS